MHALIVHAHPEPLSMNAALKEAAVRTLAECGVTVAVSDLCERGFNPVAGRDDFLRMANPERLDYVHEQRHAAATRRYSPDIIAEQAGCCATSEWKRCHPTLPSRQRARIPKGDRVK